MSGDGLTAAELQAQIAARLSACDIDDDGISARFIVEEATGLEGVEALLATDEPLTRRMVATADRLVARRCLGEPLQYVLGRWGFRHLDLAVDARALIPRPETEVVAGRALEALGERPGPVLHAVDLGTGSGAIALSLVAEDPRVHVVATDISGDALDLARANLAGLGRPSSRVTLAQGDWYEALSSDLRGQLDLIVSNPPYVATGDELPDSVVDWEPTGALLGGPEGLDDLISVLIQGREWLAPDAMIVLEMGAEHGAELQDVARSLGYVEPEVGFDLAGQPRVFAARWTGHSLPLRSFDGFIELLAAGEVLVAPTDTVPGVLAMGSDVDAVRRVFDLKRRSLDLGLPLLVADLDQAFSVGQFDPQAELLARRFWPGPLSLVVERVGGPDPITGLTTVALRCPADPLLRSLASSAGPLTGTSANLHGQQVCDSADDAAEALGVDTSRVIAGPSGATKASTVVSVKEGRLDVLREGPISNDQLLAALRET